MRLQIHWLFGLLLLLAAVSGHQIEALILLGSLVAHEIAHLVVAWVLGVEVYELILTPFGGMARMDGSLELDPQAETSVALAGPFQSFFLAGLAIFLMGSDLWDQRQVRFFYELNANLAFFNLIPALPLDGGRALRGLLAQRWGYRRVTAWMIRLGRIIGVGLVLAVLLVFLQTGSVVITPLVGGIFLALGANREGEEAVYRSYQHFLRKRERLALRRIMAAHHLVVVADARLGEVLQHLADRRYHMVLVVDESLHPMGTLPESALMDAFTELGPHATMAEILRR